MDGEPEGAGQVVPIRQDSSTCPFLHTVREAMESSGERVSHLCLSRTNDPITISGRYVDAFCLTDQHVSCSLFIHADEEAKRHALRTRASTSMELTSGQMEPKSVEEEPVREAIAAGDSEIEGAGASEPASGPVTPAGSAGVLRVIHRFLHRRAGPDIQDPESVAVTPAPSDSAAESEMPSPGQVQAEEATPNAYSSEVMDREPAHAGTPDTIANQPVSVGPATPSIMQPEPTDPERTEHEIVAPAPAGSIRVHEESIRAELLDSAIQQSPESELAHVDSVTPQAAEVSTTTVDVATPPAQLVTPDAAPPDRGAYRVIEPKPIAAERDRPVLGMDEPRTPGTHTVEIPAARRDVAGQATETEAKPAFQESGGVKQIVPTLVETDPPRAEPAQVEVAEYGRADDAPTGHAPGEPGRTTQKATSDQQVLPIPVEAAPEAEPPHYGELPERELRTRAADDSERTVPEVVPVIAHEENVLSRRRVSKAPEIEAVHLVEPAPDVHSLAALPTAEVSSRVAEAEDTEQAREREPKPETSTEALDLETAAAASTPVETAEAPVVWHPDTFLEPSTDVDEAPFEHQPGSGRKEGPSRTVVAVIAVFLVCAVILALLVFVLTSRSHSSAPAGSAHTPVPAAVPTSRPVASRAAGETRSATSQPTVGTSGPATSEPTIPAPRRTWHFLPLSGPADAVVLMFSNKNPYRVIARVRFAGGQATATRIAIPAGSGTQVELAPQAAATPLQVHASARIVVGRMVVKGTKTHFSYGLPGR